MIDRVHEEPLRVKLFDLDYIWIDCENSRLHYVLKSIHDAILSISEEKSHYEKVMAVMEHQAGNFCTIDHYIETPYTDVQRGSFRMYSFYGLTFFSESLYVNRPAFPAARIFDKPACTHIMDITSAENQTIYQELQKTYDIEEFEVIFDMPTNSGNISKSIGLMPIRMPSIKKYIKEV